MVGLLGGLDVCRVGSMIDMCRLTVGVGSKRVYLTIRQRMNGRFLVAKMVSVYGIRGQTSMTS